MKYLFLTILLIVLLFILFRYFKKFKINSFHAIVVNYYVCIITGLLFLNQSSELKSLSFDLSWVRLGIYTGSLFVGSFYLMALTVEKVNIAVATISSKMSLILPVLFSLIFLKKGPDHISVINITGIGLAILAIVLTSLKKETKDRHYENKTILILLPASVFILSGAIDTLINYTNHVFLKGQHQAVFPLIMFATAALTGTVFILIKMMLYMNTITWKDVAGGIILGIPNYFSLYFLLKTLSDFNNDAALVFPVVNIGIIIIASLVAVILFKEKLSKINLAGICFSVISIILVFW